MTEKVLFIGNGLNRLQDHRSGWNDLLNDLAGEAVTEHEEQVRKAKPFTLWFEEINSLSSSTAEVKKRIAEILKTLTPQELHWKLMDFPAKHILTTNYDYALENTTDESWGSGKTAQETYHSLFRHRIFNNKSIWHIHGEISNPGSIMLGHDHYAKYIQKIRNYLSTGVPTESKQRDKTPYYSKFAKSKKDDRKYVESWVDVFLEHEVHMIGFGFDYTENHLWSLAMEKKKLIDENSDIGQLIFHRCSDKRQTVADEARVSLLKSFGVKVVDYVKKDFGTSYESCIDSLLE